MHITLFSEKFPLIVLVISTYHIHPTGQSQLITRCITLTSKHLAGLHKILGHRFREYDPKVALVCDKRSIVNKRPCLFLHGFNNDRSQAFDFYKNYCIAGNTLIFNFPDVVGEQKTDLRRTSFSQENDVFAAIAVLRQAQNENIFFDSIDIFGFSRGAGTAGNMIHVLANPTKAQEEKLAVLEIDTHKRRELLATIRRGSVILDRPLVNLRAYLQALGKHHADKLLEKPRDALYKSSLCQILHYIENHSATSAVSKGLFFSLAMLTHYASMGIVTGFNYSPFGLNLWDSSSALRDLGIKTLLHFQHRDVVVSNEYDISLYEKIARGNREDTYVIFGNNGGHNCKPYDLVPYAHTFRKKYGGSYDPYLALHPAALEAMCQPVVVKHKPFIKYLKK